MRAESNLASLSLSVSAPTEEMMPVMSYETLTASSLVLAELTSNKSELVQLSGSIHHIAGRAYKRNICQQTSQRHNWARCSGKSHRLRRRGIAAKLGQQVRRNMLHFVLDRREKKSERCQLVRRAMRRQGRSRGLSEATRLRGGNAGSYTFGFLHLYICKMNGGRVCV